jgi:hypothetical protein
VIYIYTSQKKKPWPALLPDLNPSEHLWDEHGRRVRRRVNPPESIVQLQRALTDEWNNIPQAFSMRLIGSMRRRCIAVINARGEREYNWSHDFVTITNAI